MSHESSINRKFKWYLMGLTLLMSLFYTFMCLDYLEKGVDIGIKIHMELAGRDYAERLALNPDAEPPAAPGMSVYSHWQQAPASYQQLFPEEKHKPHTFLFQHQEHEDVFLAFLPYPVSEEKVVYFVRQYAFDQISEVRLKEADELVLFTFPVALAFIFVAVALTYRFGKQFQTSVNDLITWSDQLNVNTLQNKKPNFVFDELNYISAKLHRAFVEIAAALGEKQRFLQFASHELRTPLSLALVNVETIEAKGTPASIEKQFNRIAEATREMTELTTTLLWLSREKEEVPAVSRFAFDELVKDTVERYRYLLEGKDIRLESALETGHVVQSKPVLSMILSNLIANAFKHTSSGSIRIACATGIFSIKNQSKKNHHSSSTEALGFGLGLLLVDQLIAKMGWSCKKKDLCGGKDISLYFHHSQSGSGQMTSPSEPVAGRAKNRRRASL